MLDTTSALAHHRPVFRKTRRSSTAPPSRSRARTRSWFGSADGRAGGAHYLVSRRPPGLRRVFGMVAAVALCCFNVACPKKDQLSIQQLEKLEAQLTDDLAAAVRRDDPDAAHTILGRLNAVQAAISDQQGASTGVKPGHVIARFPVADTDENTGQNTARGTAASAASQAAQQTARSSTSRPKMPGGHHSPPKPAHSHH